MRETGLNGIFYDVKGSGERTIVLLRGLARWSDHWLGFEKFLADKGFRVITVDNRGFGKSSDAESSKNLTVHDLADDVAQVISKEAPGGAHVVGLSLGAMIGLALAAMKPQLVRSLMMVNSSVGGSKIPRISKRALFSILQIAVMGRRGYDPLSRVILSPESPNSKREKLSKSWSEIDREHRVSLRRLFSQLRAARGFQGFVEMASIKCPVTIVRCDQDKFVDPRNSDFIHRQIPSAEIVKHPTAGHELAVDDPDWFVDVIISALNRAESTKNS